MNQSLSRSLSKLVNEDQTNWDEKLETLLSACRVSKQKSTGYSPFYMMFHRQPLLTIDSELVQSFKNDDEPDIEAFIDRMIDIRDKIKEVASRNISKSQSEQKKYYDSKHSTEVLIFSLAMFHLSFFLFP